MIRIGDGLVGTFQTVLKSYELKNFVWRPLD